MARACFGRARGVAVNMGREVADRFARRVRPRGDVPVRTTQDTAERLAVALAGRYRIERLVGEGGMATVFLAADLRHDRRVAVKVIRPELVETLGADRFAREIRTTATLHHPHILPLHDSGEIDGLLYYVMPFVEGESLRDRLRREHQLSLEDALRITADVADALTYAHQQGVLHRDIKPENILLAGDNTFVADFGIAKQADPEATSISLTSAGVVVGTPTYMSPEQSTGNPNLNGRADQYSLACVTYEMLAGEPPFTGSSVQAVLARHAIAPVPSIRTVRPSVSPAIEAVITRALAKNAADRYATPTQYAAALQTAVTSPSIPVPLPASTRGRLWRMATVVAALAIAIFAGVTYSRRNAVRDRPPMLVVLPFRFEGDSSRRFFADGLTDEITSRLSRLSGLSVIARSAAAAYARDGKSPQEIGQELGVDYILEGSVRDDGGVLRVTPDLINVRDSRSIGALEPQTIQFVSGKLFTVQNLIAERVAAELDVVIAPVEREALRAEPTENSEAYQAYLRGIALEPRRAPASAALQGIVHFQQAVALDPRFAVAWARLAIAHARFFNNYDPTPARRDSAKFAIDSAVALAPDLPDVRLAKAITQLHIDRPDSSALEGILRTLNTRSNESDLLVLTGTAWRRLGHWNEAVVAFERALRLNPRGQSNALDLGITHMVMRNYPEAGRYLDRALEVAPDWELAWTYRILEVLASTGNVDSARAVFRRGAARVGFIPMLSQLVRFPYTLEALGPSINDSLPRIPGGSIPFDSTLYLMELAQWHASRGRVAAARTEFLRAREVAMARVRKAPADPQARPLLAKILAELGDTVAAGAQSDTAWAQLSRLNDAFFRGAFRQYVVRADVAARRYDVAFDRLDLMLSEPGPTSVPYLRGDPTMSALRSLPRFEPLMAKYSSSRR